MGNRPTCSKPTNDESTVCPYDGTGPWFACSPDAVVAPRLASSGPASAVECAPTTLPQLLIEAARRHASKPAMKVERPIPELVDGKAPPALPMEEWTTWTFEDYLESTRTVAKAFIRLGLLRFDSVAVWGFNAPEWMISATAANFAGGKIAGLYPTDSPETAAYKVVQSGARIVVVEDRNKLKRLVGGLASRNDCTRLKAIVAYGFKPESGETVDIATGREHLTVPVLSWEALMSMGNGSDEELDKRTTAIQPGECAALIYTSGTTGEPKAVMISHDNIVFESKNVLRILHQSCGIGAKAEQERLLSYLPLSHVAGMMIDIVSPLACSATDAWATTYFARSYDLKAGSLKDRLKAVRPTIFIGVPMVWEKIADKIRTMGSSVQGLKKCIGQWAKGRGLEYATRCQVGGNGRKPQGYRTADKLVLHKLKENLGLDECKFGGTGAAPIRVDTLAFFGSLGLRIHEVYGMSESTGACTWSSDQAHQWGSCGWEMPGLEVRAFKVHESDMNEKKLCPLAPGLDAVGSEEFQGELCYRGRSIMMGYMANPDLGAAHVKEISQKTAETIDADGWLHSGDKGMVTADGMVKITGRYKEIIIGDGGENIAPVPIEDHVKKVCDGVAEIMMIGDKRKYNVALVTLKAVGANGEGAGTDDLDAGAKIINPDVTKISQALDDPAWIKAVTEAIVSANKNPKVCINNAFAIQKFMILPHNFSEQANELTPTKKLKRKVVEARYSEAIEHMYATNGTYIRYLKE